MGEAEGGTEEPRRPDRELDGAAHRGRKRYVTAAAMALNRFSMTACLIPRVMNTMRDP